MATLRDLRKRLKAVNNTQKITKAMKMIAASKLRRAQQAILQARPYALRMQEVLGHVVSRAEVESHPLLAVRPPRKVQLVVMTSNRGLCGGFNSTILRSAERFIAENRPHLEELQVSTIGRKARDHFRRKGISIQQSWENVWEQLEFERAVEIANDLAARFKSGELDAVYLLYNEFKSAISQNQTIMQLLPIQPIEDWMERQAKIGELAAISGNAEASQGAVRPLVMPTQKSGWQPQTASEQEAYGYEHLFEPSRQEVLEALLPQHLAIQIWRALLESNAALYGAQMSAMDAASRNAKELFGKLTIKANRVRQASITTELMEIVSGAESLKG
ncbi:MAG: ATP synthase F1 subunit gamma [Deltaproteobacteria bacterium]|jgi:F-type H+-transporting ATPase subunit gamma|nr:ATP synthase F1 subunit gamma [Deltaproteobacteria bacterium]